MRRWTLEATARSGRALRSRGRVRSHKHLRDDQFCKNATMALADRTAGHQPADVNREGISR